MQQVAQAIDGAEESLGCPGQVQAALERLWKRNEGSGTRYALANWEEERLESKVGADLTRRRKVGGWGAVWREVRKGYFKKKGTEYKLESEDSK